MGWSVKKTVRESQKKTRTLTSSGARERVMIEIHREMTFALSCWCDAWLGERTALAQGAVLR